MVSRLALPAQADAAHCAQPQREGSSFSEFVRNAL